ncbi:MAG: NAD(P)-dependent oxidoreductase [Candidatus Eremiobacteraeota bacterium]|nr:NAD(P)-dependent oxidoreductase [Candidatus Eremiobacteraeota bacterium]
MATLGESIHKPLTALEVKLEANRCLSCYDAPCMNACPTHIDVASFIAKIASDNLRGSARVIMDANPMGASCARVCPTDELCEGACVYKKDDTPIRIGDLQRYSIDWLMRSGIKLFEPGAPTGKSVAIIGGGPAGLSAARDLRRTGHAVTIFEARDELGGLNTYGIVPFRLTTEVALWEAQQVLDLGVDVRTSTQIGRDIHMESLLEDFDAVVLACGMGGVPLLGIPGEDLPGVWDALDFIERAKVGTLRPSFAQKGGGVEHASNSEVFAGQQVAVIGAGNTAIDALTCAKRLGAERVTMHFRRGEEHMNAYDFEYDFARQENIEFRFFCAPVRILEDAGRVGGIEFVRTRLQDDLPVAIPGSEFIEPADTIIRAIGQSRFVDTLDKFGIAHDGGVVCVNERLETTRKGIFAAGDCIFEKGMREAMVVEAAEQGKQAARSVDTFLSGTA